MLRQWQQLFASLKLKLGSNGEGVAVSRRMSCGREVKNCWPGLSLVLWSTRSRTIDTAQQTVCVYVCVCTCVCVYVYRSACGCAAVCARMSAHACVCVCMHVYVCVRSNMPVWHTSHHGRAPPLPPSPHSPLSLHSHPKYLLDPACALGPALRTRRTRVLAEPTPAASASSHTRGRACSRHIPTGATVPHLASPCCTSHLPPVKGLG